MSENDVHIADLYRSVSVEEPPSHLDARLADAARHPHKPGMERKQRPWWMLWRVPFAVAAVALVSASLVSLTMEQGGEELTSAPRQSAPRSRAADAPPAPIRAEPEIQPQNEQHTLADSRSRTGTTGRDKAEVSAESRTPARESAQRRDRHAAPPPATVREPEAGSAERLAAAPEADAVSKKSPGPAETGSAASARDVQTAPTQAAGGTPQASAPLESRAPTPAPAAAAARAFKRADSIEGQVAGAISKHAIELSGRPPADWIERITLLRREGRRAEADALLEEFMRRYPREPVSVDLTEK